MSELVEWLKERLDETEQTARDAADGHRGEWLAGTGPPESEPYEVYQLGLPVGSPHVCTEHQGRRPNACDDNAIIEVDGDFCRDEAVARHVAAFDPRSVLALVEAHRLILSYHSGSHECSGPDENCMWILDGEVCPTVRALASAFKHLPGYVEEWGPT